MGEGLYCLHGIEGFARARAGIGHAILTFAGQRAHPAAEPDQRHHDESDGRQHEDGKLQAGEKQQNKTARQHDQVAHRNRRRGADHGLNERGVGGEAGEHFARARDFEEGRRQRQDMVEDGLADIGDHTFAKPGHEIEPGGGGDAQDGGDRDQRHEVLADLRGIFFIEAMIHHPPHGHRHDEAGRRRANERDPCDHDAGAVWPQERAKPPQRFKGPGFFAARRRVRHLGGKICAGFGHLPLLWPNPI